MYSFRAKGKDILLCFFYVTSHMSLLVHISKIFAFNAPCSFALRWQCTCLGLGPTPLCPTAMGTSLNIFSFKAAMFLSRPGTNPNVSYSNGNTPLIMAIQENHTAIGNANEFSYPIYILLGFMSVCV